MATAAAAPAPHEQSRLIPIRSRAALAIALVSVVGLASFLRPLLVVRGWPHDATVASLILAARCRCLSSSAEVSRGGSRQAIAMLGCCPRSGGVASGPAPPDPRRCSSSLRRPRLRPGFGFVSAPPPGSALLTGGVGPWLPFQMMAAAWVGLFAGLLPRARGRAEMGLLVAYGIVAGLGYGIIMNFSFWPFAVGLGTQVSYVPGAAVLDNLHRFIVFSVSTSLGWDLGRSLLNAVAILLIGPAVLAALRRIARRAAFGLVIDRTRGGQPTGAADRTRSHELRQ